MSDAATATVDTTDAPGSTDTGSTDPDPLEAAKADAAKWKDLARKHEDRAKANANAAKELDAFKAQTMTDHEKAVEAARNEGRDETRRTLATRLVDSEVRVAATGRNVDVDALLEGLDRARFMDDNGEPKTDEIRAWMDRVAPVVPDEEPPPAKGRVDLGQGVRPSKDSTLPLNGDPIEAELRRKLGMPPA